MRVVKAGLVDPIPLGKRGEQNATQVEFDLSSFIRDFGEGVPGLTVRRPGDSKEYAANLERRGNTAVWTIGAEWTATDGQGRCELSWFVGEDTIAKDTRSWHTAVTESMGAGGGSPTAPEMAYLAKIQQAGTRAEQAAEEVNAAGKEMLELARGFDGAVVQVKKDIETTAEQHKQELAGFAVHPPMIGANGNWWLWDGKEYADSGTPSQGSVVQSETDAKYFDIDYDGIVSLKPEYRGRPGHELDTTFDDTAAIVNSCPYAVSDNGLGKDGSKNAELPEEIVIPEVINGTAVAGFQPGMFYGNFRLRKLILPPTVTALPDYFCTEARYLQEVKNTEHIRELGDAAFKNTRIAKAIFPNLRAWGNQVFRNCVLLCIADIGDYVDRMPYYAFRACRSLSRILGGANIKEIGEEAFYKATAIRNLPLLAGVTSISDEAFTVCRVNFDWSTIEGTCQFGKNATPVADNTYDYWSGAAFAPCEHQLNTLMNQSDPRWKDEQMDPTGVLVKNFNTGCAMFALLHIHSAITGAVYNAPQEFMLELQRNGYDTSKSIGSYSVVNGERVSNAECAIKTLGYATTCNGFRATAITGEKYQELCDKLSFGAYAYLTQSTPGKTVDNGHAVMVFGINEIGELLVVDSANAYNGVNLCEEGFTYWMPMRNFTGPKSDVLIIEKLDGLTARIGEQSGVLYVDGTDDVITTEIKDGVLYVDGSISARVENGILYVD